MAYNIVKSDGTPLVSVNDGQTNNTATSLTLVGKNFAGYGTFLNENFLKLLENFASSTQPANPITGQVWYQTSTRVLQIYNGSAWKSISGAQSQADEPVYKVSGDLWFDSVNQQLKVWSGAGWIVIGPSFTSTTGTSGAVADTIIDSSQFSHVVVKFFVQNQLVAVLSKDAAFQPQTTIPGFPSVKPGLNLARGTVPELVFYENANNASYLGQVAADQYLTKDNAVLTSKLVIQNNDGIVLKDAVGTITNFTMGINNAFVELASLVRAQGFKIITYPDNAGGNPQTVLEVDKTTGLIRVLNDPTDQAGVSTKNYVDTRDNNTRTMLQNNVAAINSNVSVLGANTTITYGNIRNTQYELGFNFNTLVPQSSGISVGAGVTHAQAYQLFTQNSSVGSTTFAGNLLTLWANVATMHSNILSLGGIGGTNTSSMYANVKSIQGRTSSLENDALRRDGTLSITGNLVVDTSLARDLGSTSKRFNTFWTQNVAATNLTGITSINTSGDRASNQSITIYADPVQITGNIKFADPDGSNNAKWGVNGPLRVGGTLTVDGNLVPVGNEGNSLGTLTQRFDNLWSKRIQADSIWIGGSVALSSAGLASQGDLVVTGDLKPKTDLTYNIGTMTGSNLRWKEVFATKFTSDDGISISKAGMTHNVSGANPPIGATGARFGALYYTQLNGSTFYTSTAGIFIDSGTATQTVDIGASSQAFRNIYCSTLYGKATAAQYADLAERFEADAVYVPGTVVRIGGDKEVTVETADRSEDVFGVVSTNPAYLMNEGAGTNETHPPIALSGRVPVRVVGAVAKGQRLVSAGNGCARAAEAGEATPFNTIGRALEHKSTAHEELIMVVVKTGN